MDDKSNPDREFDEAIANDQKKREQIRQEERQRRQERERQVAKVEAAIDTWNRGTERAISIAVSSRNNRMGGTGVHLNWTAERIDTNTAPPQRPMMPRLPLVRITAEQGEMTMGIDENNGMVAITDSTGEAPGPIDPAAFVPQIEGLIKGFAARLIRSQ
jgi:hypothetical protein